MDHQKKLVVIGAGAAGFFCAVNAARLHPELEVIILEKTSKLLSKVRVSGGGRCNVTHACFDIAEMSKRYPRGRHFVKKSFHQFFTSDTVKWFEDRGVKLKTEEDGRIFPITDSSDTIISCLLKEASIYRVDIRMNATVEKIVPGKGKILLQVSGRQEFVADYVCVACGGFPKAAMFGWLEELGHSIAEPLPSLFTFNLPRRQAGLPDLQTGLSGLQTGLPGSQSNMSKHPITKLMGISVENARIKIEGSKLQDEGALLITHWGISGPAVLKLSAWGAREFSLNNYSFRIHINWMPGKNEKDIKEILQQFRLEEPSKKISSRNFTHLPKRLWEFLLHESGIKEDDRLGELISKNENSLARNLVDYVLQVAGKTTFKEEFVTAGGIKLDEVDVNTMMSKKVPGLYFAGEILDVDGITGGYNFQHAWTSGYIAAKSIGIKSE